MKINPITSNQNFEGKLIIKEPISKKQRNLVNHHKPVLESMIKDMPFDLFVEQSKSKKTMNLSTNVEGAGSYAVIKNKQDIEQTASLALRDAMGKSEAYKKLVKANEILYYVKLHLYNVISGKFKEARDAHKQLAQLAVKDFDIYRSMINFRITGFPSGVNLMLIKNSIGYKIYNAFSRKTPEEKQLIKMNKEYIKEMKAQNKEIKPTIIRYFNSF